MTVRVNKQPFNIREKLSELERPIGVKGHELMGAETAQDARDFISAGRKNALYNGDMQIWQRGTLFANGGGGAQVNYTADRWNSTRYISSENDVSREDANHLGFRYCLRSARGGGDTATTARYVSQVLEQKDTWKLRGKYVTFSFYLRIGSGFNGGVVFSSITYHTDSSREERFHYDQFQNGNNTRSRIAHRSLSADWKRYTHTTYIPDNAQQVGVALSSNENLPNSVSADYFEMTGCQLEVGRNATEFEHRSYGEELELCQRYYEKHEWTASQYIAASISHNTGTGSRFTFPFLTRKRTTNPSFTASGTYVGYPPNESVTLTGAEDNDTAARINVSRTTSYSSGTGILLLSSGAGNYFVIEDEL